MNLDEWLAKIKISDLGENFYLRVGAFEKKLIELALKASSGVKSGAADKLCLERTTLNEKIKKYGIRIERPPFQSIQSEPLSQKVSEVLEDQSCNQSLELFQDGLL